MAAANLASEPVCIHPDSREAFAGLELSDRSYSFNGNHYRCAGGLATVSMALDIVRQDPGEQLCIAICGDLMIPLPPVQGCCGNIWRLKSGLGDGQ